MRRTNITYGHEYLMGGVVRGGTREALALRSWVRAPTVAEHVFFAQKIMRLGLHDGREHEPPLEIDDL